jgi:mono/diheme cytochrome c family protein
MQHNARDPLRDHVHGRIYRVTYPSRPLVEPAKIAGASIDVLLDNLLLPEYRTRYRTRRELRGRKASEVLPALRDWVKSLNKEDPRVEHHMLEALWVSWGLNKVDQSLLLDLLKAKDFHVRAAAVRVLRYNGHQIANQAGLLAKSASDENARVRLEAIVAASWLSTDAGLSVLAQAKKKPLDEWMAYAYETSEAHLNGKSVREKNDEEIKTHLTGDDRDLFIRGKEIYARDGYCATCHQPGGEGLSASGFPPLSNTSWVVGNEDRLIKIALKGLLGPIEVSDKTYPGQVPMTPFEGLLKDDEVAAVLTYVRNSFGNKATVITPEKVKAIREEIKGKTGFYSPDELLKDHPLEK